MSRSRVTVGDLLWDCKNSAIISRGDVSKIEDVEIVPRKMVEIIIDKCNDEIDYCKQFEGNEYYDGKADGVGFIKNITKMLLKEFDDDGEV